MIYDYQDAGFIRIFTPAYAKAERFPLCFALERGFCFYRLMPLIQIKTYLVQIRNAARSSGRQLSVCDILDCRTLQMIAVKPSVQPCFALLAVADMGVLVAVGRPAHVG